jgi:hypothetical protein
LCSNIQRYVVDCNTATRFIAKIVRKGIILRDANHFHHIYDKKVRSPQWVEKLFKELHQQWAVAHHIDFIQRGKHLLFWLANTVLFISTNTFHSHAYLLSFWM